MRVPLILLFFLLFLTSQGQDYYDGTNGLTGAELKLKLHQIINNHTVRTYSEFRDVILPDLDEDPANSDNIILFYKNNSIPKSDFAVDNDSWNREHTWPSSHGFSNTSDTAYTDVHNLRPSDASVNTSKSNKDFNDVEHIAANEQGEAPDTYTTEDFWEPRDEIKGDVARILFYMDVRYESDRLDLEIKDRETFSEPEIGVLYTLIKWHEQDPVDAAEMTRHEGAVGYQGNRNPFIDHPEWVAEIYGSTQSPLLALDAPNLNTDFGTVELGSSATQQYALNAYNLTDDVSVKVDAPFSLSTDNTNWSDSIGYTNDGSGEQVFDVHLRYEPGQTDEMAEATVRHFTDMDTISVNVTGNEGSIDLLTIAEARQQNLGEIVQITGVVIDAGNNSSNNRVIYDGTAGIVVRSFDAGNESTNLVQGDSVVVSGGLSEFAELLQIEESPITIDLISQNATLPEPQLVTLDEIDEDLESQLVRVEEVAFISTGTFQGGGSAGNFLIGKGANVFIVRLGSDNHPLVGSAIPSQQVNIVGFVGQFNSDYQLSPRTLEDLELGALGFTEIGQTQDLFYPNPATHAIRLNAPNNSPILHLSVIDMQGKYVLKTDNPEDNIELNNLGRGTYILVVETIDSVYYSKLIKE